MQNLGSFFEKVPNFGDFSPLSFFIHFHFFCNFWPINTSTMKQRLDKNSVGLRGTPKERDRDHLIGSSGTCGLASRLRRRFKLKWLKVHPTTHPLLNLILEVIYRPFELKIRLKVGLSGPKMIPKQLMNNHKSTFKKSEKRLFGPQNCQNDPLRGSKFVPKILIF